MEQLIEAIKSNDLVKAKKAFGSIMLERASALVEAEKIAMAKSVMIEGEESEERDEKEENEKDAKKPNKFEKEELDDSEEDEDEEEE